MGLVEKMQTCGCAVCAARGNAGIATTRRSGRLRGFELEFSGRAVGNIDCKHHERVRCQRGPRCSEVVRVQQLNTACACEACVQAGLAPATPPAITCPGHPCIQPDVPGGSSLYFRDLVHESVGADKCHGNFKEWHKTVRDFKRFDLKTDSSCGFEIATPPWTGPDVRPNLGPLLDGICKAEKMHKQSFVTESCGLHCTFDVADLRLRALKQLALFTARHQAALLGTQPQSRWSNTYCKPFKKGRIFRRAIARASDLSALVATTPGLNDRFVICNISRLVGNEERLIEFRFGAGTSDIRRVDAISALLECLIEAAISTPVIVSTNDRKKRLYKEVIEPFIGDPRIQQAWEDIIQPALREIELPRC